MSLNDLFVNMNLVIHLSFLAGWAILLLLVDLFIPKGKKYITAILTVLGLFITIALVVMRMGEPVSAFNGMVILDGFSAFLSIVLLITGVAAVMLAFDYLRRMGIEQGEYYVLLLFAVLGMMLMVSSTDLIMIFLALELLSIPLYILTGIAVPKAESEEGAMKYFILGAFATGFVLYGIALIYGATGTTELKAIVAGTGMMDFLMLLPIGAALLLIGFSFKVALVPFHMWTPDVYQGAPTSVTAFMAIGAKVAGFAALMRVFVLAFPSLSHYFTPVLWILAVLTMVLGNVIAISQTNIKRMLAYSSIANAGYIAMALVPYAEDKTAITAVASALFYLFSYAVTSFAAWAVVIALEHQAEGETESNGLLIKDYAGLGKKSPLLAAIMAVAMFSFAGVPPTLGFVGKFYLFRTVLEGGFIWLALIGVLTSLISAFYYLRVIVYMYMYDGEPVIRKETWLYLTAIAGGVGVLLLGIFANPIFSWATQAFLELI